MAVLRIIAPVRLRLVDNLPLSNNPRRFVGLRIVSPLRVRVGKGSGTVTVSGTVKNNEGAALPGRTVRIFNDQGMSLLLNTVYSQADGSFSAPVAGGAGSRFTVVAQGETGENVTVFGNVVKTG